MATGRQLRLLLWKDYLIRKRKLITLAGIIWATMVMMCLYVVRINVDNQDFPTCQFPARALPSAGMLPFLQSFICSVDNDCSPLDKYQEIPTYENAKLTQLQRRFSPLLHNETVLEVAGIVPGALKLMATFANVLDDPAMVDISKNGLRVSGLFASPVRVRRYLAAELNVSNDAAGSIMEAKLSLTAIFSGNFDRCNANSVASLFQMDDQEYLAEFSHRLCGLTDKDVQRLAGGLLNEINFSKYISMVSKMYYKISGDSRVPALAEMATAVMRLIKIESFLPKVVTSVLLGREVDFTYFDAAWITQLMDLLEPAFGGTKTYQTLRDFTDMVTTALQYLDKLLAGQSSDSVRQAAGLALTQVGKSSGVDQINEVFNKAADLFERAASEEFSVDVFKILAQVMNTINKFLPDSTKHEVLLYSTLLAKLIEGANRVVTINMNIQDMAYEVSLRNPNGVKVLMGLPVDVVRKGFEGLADAERVQIVTSKLNVRGQIFCESKKLSHFFRVSKDEANKLKNQLCTDAWKNYVTDLIKSFGIYDVKDTINNMASIVVQETFGKDVSDQLYTIEKDFETLKNFTQTLVAMKTKPKVVVDWNSLFNVTQDSAFMKIFTERRHLGKQILITVHGALAKEVVKQNAILDFKITPILMDFTTIVNAVKDQLAETPASTTERVKTLYPSIVQAMLTTLLNEDKTYKALSTPSEKVFCSGAEAASAYLELSAAGADDMLAAVCDATKAIETGLTGDSKIAQAIAAVKESSHSPFDDVDWTGLIDGLKQVYIKLDSDYPYLFKFTSYGMTAEGQQRVQALMEQAKDYWFSIRRMDRSLHLSIKVVFRLLDLVDRPVFRITNEDWQKMKYAFQSATAPLVVVDDFVKLLAALANNQTYSSRLPTITSQALADIIPNIPHLVVDAVDMIVNQDIELEPIVSLMSAEPAWPCTNDSLADVLPLSDPAHAALHAFEDLMCLEDGVRDEWLDFIQANNITVYNASNWKTATFGPHLFLKFSSVFDALVADTALVRGLLEELVNSSQGEGRLDMAGAWKYAAGVFEGTDRNDSLRTLFANMDTILNSVRAAPGGQQSASGLWEEYSGCSGSRCAALWRAAWKATLQALSVVLQDAAGDLATYFGEINEPNANVLQMLGFTRKTGLYILYDKLPEFVAALLNSYWDYGFMSQVRRAALTEFWDCDAVVSALAPAPGSGLDAATIKRVKPFICPSLLYWISLPRGDNTFLDIVAKPQYTFFTLPAQNLTSSFADAFNKSTALVNLLATAANKTETPLEEEEIKFDSLQDKLKKTVDTVLNYKIDENDPAYRLFTEINKKQFMSATYLTRITAMVNKMAVSIDKLKSNDINKELNEEDVKKLQADLSTFAKIFKRRPNEAIALHFDVITRMLFANDDFDLVKAFEDVCGDFKNDDNSKDILNEEQRTKNQICSKQYKVIYGAVQSVIVDDYEATKKSLISLVNALQDSSDDVPDVVKFFNDRKKLVYSLKTSIKYSYELSLPVYLAYLQSNLQSYSVVLSFLRGGDWWRDLRAQYAGPHVATFLDAVENSFEVADDILRKPDGIHLVRLLRDVNVNDTEAFCLPNVTLSDYVPDATGALSRLKRQACAADTEQVFREIPPLVIAAQGYNDDLAISKEINYTALYAYISATESGLEAIKDGPKAPKRPDWVTDEKISQLRSVATSLLSKDMLTKMSFGVLSNIVDASTLFLNNTQCALCSHFTTLFKQLNLQLYKKQEYDRLLCQLDTMTVEQVHHALKNDFHWDMAFRELVSYRNYTKYELNKSLNELLGQIKLHLLEDMHAARSKVWECLAPDAAHDHLGHASLLLKVLSHTITLIRAELPHLHEVEGMDQVPFLKEMLSQVSPTLDVYAPLSDYTIEGNTINAELAAFLPEEAVRVIARGEVNLRVVRKSSDEKSRYKYMRTATGDAPWSEACLNEDCARIVAIIDRNINRTTVDKNLSKEQETEFWKFGHLSDILQHVESVVWWAARLVALGSRLDARAALRGRLAPALDALMEATTDDSLAVIRASIEGILHEIEPLLQGSALRRDLTAFTDGLLHLKSYKDDLANEDIRVPVGALWGGAARLEAALGAQGLNNTNFWSLAAPRLHAGHILLKPIFSWRSGDHIGNYVCQLDAMGTVLQPGDLGVVSREDVLGAVAEQFCALSDARARRLLATLLQHGNYTYVIDKVTDFLLPKLYSASHLSLEEGSSVMSGLPLMARVLPGVQAQVGEVADSFSGDPLFRSLANFSSVGGLLGSSDFLSSAGNMLCGKPFVTAIPRLYRSVISGEDHADQPDQRQLEVLPTEFCRSLYKDIINVEGGKIVWSFVKPLIMGRVLYTPANPVVNDIIHRANASFAHMARLASLIHSFAASFPAVEQLSSHKEGVGVLSRLLSAPSFADLRSMLLPDGEAPNVDLEEIFDEFGDMSDIGSILSKVSDLLHCVNLDRFHAAASEEQLAHEAAQLSMVNEFSAGLVFLNSEHQGGVPTNIEYKIRMDIENTPTTRRLKNYLWIPGPEANFLENMRYFRGFVQLQDLVNQAIIASASDASRHKRDTAHEEVNWAVYTQQMPYACYRKDFFQTSLYESQALIVCFFFSLLYSVAAAVRFVVADHESGNTMLMHVMGVRLSHLTLSWFLWSSLEMAVTVGCLTLVLCAGGILPRTDPSLVFALILIFGFAVLCFCYMISKLFSKASFAAVCAAIAYLLSFMPVVLILSLEAVITRAAKIVICFSMSSSLCYAFLHITRLEATGTGGHWASIWEATDSQDISIGLSAIMMLIDAAIYVAIGWTIDRYFGLATLQSNITQLGSEDEKAGVSVVNVSKTYGARAALRGVSLELRRGQLTALLGHNGAGKTTLINILTGMVRPSSGHVVVRAEAGAALGACPQRDVLFEHMTAREHVALYAQLKSGKPLDQLQDEIESTLQVLSLGALGGQAARRLSGGTRRRLCVALAFVCAPHLVTLDEPTAGVDPSARREIWSMIARLKEGRTILLTTHHLDEADLLSDQIVIMHKGQIHTTGSPIEIKRTLGNGYKLSVSYPPGEWEEPSMEERSKSLLTLVRSVVRNAALADVGGFTVDLTLPFFDADGLNNDFLLLCTTLESNQEALGFSSYSMECSSLEQVFYNVCREADDQPLPTQYESVEDIASKSTSTSSIRTEGAPLVSGSGPLTGTKLQQFLALMRARYIHYIRNRWLLFVVLVLPSLFVGIAMGFSTIRPPADNEIALHLHPGLYANTTQFIIPEPSVYSEQIDPSFARHVMDQLMFDKSFKNWTARDTPACSCRDAMQVCNITDEPRRPDLMLLPDVETLNDWLVSTQKDYIEKRYGGYSSSLASNLSTLTAWYNNKGHHALPAFLGALHSALLRTATGNTRANITTYSHPMKISKEQISKDTVYQHVADAGISALVVLAYSLVSAGAAVYLVGARVRQEKRLQLLSGVSPALYWTAALAADLVVIVINMAITAILMEAFHFPVFVERNNLPAICLLILLYGFSCGCLVHVAEKLFTEASVANMLLFCGNAFLGLGGITVLLILDVISDSDRTDNARWVLHKIFMLSPQFALGDGLLQIAKNTIQAQVLSRFGMDTYQDPLGSPLLAHHYLSLALVGAFLFCLNLAIEYQCFDFLISKFGSDSMPEETSGELEELDVTAERKRVQAALACARERPLRLHTIGNINAGFVDTEGQKAPAAAAAAAAAACGGDVAACVGLGKLYRSRGARAAARVALRDLTLGIPPGQCTALLGENGAGKSTTFALLTGQARASAGALLLAARRRAGSQLCTGLISYCPQSDAIDPLLTVQETLEIFCRLRGITEEEEVIKRTLDMFELHRYAGARAGALSGGNRRKLCSAVAFMSRSPLVLLDEPTSGMDPGSRGCVSRGVRAACAGGRGVLVSTHALHDARALAARVALLRAGRLRALASLDDCLTRFGGGYVVECRVAGGGARAAWARVTSLAPHAALRVMHRAALHFMLPTRAIVNKKEVTTRVSDVFRLMAELQGACDIDDYTVTQSSLEQMFLSFSDRRNSEETSLELEPLEPLPNGRDLTSVTAL